MTASIGVYDSGYGGLSVLRHIRAALPTHDLVYFGDSGRAPYGGRDVYTILDFAEQSVELLFEEGCSTVVVACHTVSCVALRHLQRRYAGIDSDHRVLGVTIPAAELAVRESAGHIGLLATERTVRSNTWATEVHKLGSHRVTQVAAALLAAIVEEGWEDTDIAERALERYLAPLAACDTILLGCTHYPWLLPAIRRVTDQVVLDPAPYVAERLADWLKRHPRFDPGPGAGMLRVLCSGDPARFARAGERFLGAPLGPVDWVGIVDSRLVRGRPGSAPVGQITR